MTPSNANAVTHSEAQGVIALPEGSTPKRVPLADAQVTGPNLPANAFILHGRRSAAKQIFSTVSVPSGSVLHFVQVMLEVSTRKNVLTTFSNLSEHHELHVSRLSHALAEELDEFWKEKLSRPASRASSVKATKDPAAGLGRAAAVRGMPHSSALQGGLGQASHPLFVRYPQFFDDLIAEHKYFKHIKVVFFPYAGIPNHGHLMQLVAVFDPSVIKSARAPSLPETTITIPRSAKGINLPHAATNAA